MLPITNTCTQVAPLSRISSRLTEFSSDIIEESLYDIVVLQYYEAKTCNFSVGEMIFCSISGAFRSYSFLKVQWTNERSWRVVRWFRVGLWKSLANIFHLFIAMLTKFLSFQIHRYEYITHLHSLQVKRFILTIFLHFIHILQLSLIYEGQ